MLVPLGVGRGRFDGGDRAQQRQSGTRDDAFAIAARVAWTASSSASCRLFISASEGAPT
jgi:hypothetical protein